MATRQEEKTRRRDERAGREAKAAAANKRRQQLLRIGLGLAALLLIGGGVYLLVSQQQDREKESLADIPAQKITNLSQAARAADCTILSPKFEGDEHSEEKSTYKANPPTSGNHHPIPADDKIYSPANTPPLERMVHSLEHGRIHLQYAKRTTETRVSQLRALVDEGNGYHQLLTENTTDMPYAVAATAWNQSIGCEQWSKQTFDALRTFRDRYLDQGPENVP